VVMRTRQSVTFYVHYLSCSRMWCCASVDNQIVTFRGNVVLCLQGSRNRKVFCMLHVTWKRFFGHSLLQVAPNRYFSLVRLAHAPFEKLCIWTAVV
jgi:hypothetical protein